MARRRLPRIARNLPTADRLEAEEISLVSTEQPRELTQEEKRAAFLALARKRFRTAADAETKLRERQLEDRRFAASDQWDPVAKANREADNKPVLTFNYLPGILQQVTNASRQSRPAIQITPVDSKGDKETALVIQDLIRTIERNSDAEAAYLTGQNDQVEMGLGYWRILREYEAEDSFNQILKIKRVRNRFTVFFDPAHQEMDFRDANYAFIVDDISREDYEAEFGKEARASLEGWAASVNAYASDWMPVGKVRVAEYFYVEREKVEVVQVALPPIREGMPIRLFVVPKSTMENLKEEPGFEYARILKSREVMRRMVKWAKINAVEILSGNEDRTEGREWGGPYIPIIPAIGREIDINGEVDYRGMIRDAKGSCCLINYAGSSLAESIGLAPKAPFLVEWSQIQGLKEYWDALNVRNLAYLPYKGKSLDGRLIPPPQRLSTEAQLSSLVQALTVAESLLRSTTALYEPSLGQEGNERSGKAILARQQRGDLGTSHYLSNWARAIKYTGEQLVTLIPGTYDIQRIQRITGEDGSSRVVMLNRGSLPKGMDEEQLRKMHGIVGIYDPSVGQYDVSISVGPSYPARRQEGQAAMIEMVRAFPSLFPVIGDLLAEASDWPGAEKIAARLHKLLDPRLREGEDQATPEALQARILQMSQQLQSLSQAYEQAQDLIRTDAQKLAAQVRMKELESVTRERVALIQAEVEAGKALAQIQENRAETILKSEIERLGIMLKAATAEADRQAERLTQGGEHE